MGGTACICEMLLQSRREELRLLPALPKAWAKGSVRNFRAQDGITVSFSWEEGKLTACSLTAKEGRQLHVLSGGSTWEVTLEADTPLSLF